MMNPFHTYKIYLAVRNHFNLENYDYFKYQGKSKAKLESFLKRRDRWIFEKLSKGAREEEVTTFFSSNFSRNQRWSVFQYNDEESMRNYSYHRRWEQSFRYMFANEVQTLFTSVAHPKELFKCSKTSYPKIMNAGRAGVVSIETISVLNFFIDFAARYDTMYGRDDAVWSMFRLPIIKLHPFLHYNKSTATATLREYV